MPISFDLEDIRVKNNCVNYFETGLYDPRCDVSSKIALSCNFDKVYCIEIRKDWVEMGNDIFKEHIMTGKYNLYLDDIREPKQSYKKTGDTRYIDLKWRVVKCYSEFVETIALNGIPNIVSFDHDLGEEHINYYFDINFL